VVTTPIIVDIPVSALYNLHVSRALKAGLVIVFGVCILGVVAAVMRFQAFLALEDFRDITEENVKPLFWTIAEGGIYLVAVCMLGLKSLVKRVFKITAFERLFDGNEEFPVKWNMVTLGLVRSGDVRMDDVHEETREMRLERVDTQQAQSAGRRL
jgi:hypothetical protein